MLKLLINAGVPALDFLTMVIVAVVVLRRVRVVRGIHLAGADPS